MSTPVHPVTPYPGYPPSPGSGGGITNVRLNTDLNIDRQFWLYTLSTSVTALASLGLLVARLGLGEIDVWFYVLAAGALVLIPVSSLWFFTKVIRPLNRIIPYLDGFAIERATPRETLTGLPEEFESFRDNLDRFFLDFGEFKTGLEEIMHAMSDHTHKSAVQYRSMISSGQTNKERASAVLGALQDINEKVNNINSTIQELAASASESSAAMEEMAQSAAQVAKNAQNVSILSEDTVKKAKSSGETVNETIRGINNISSTIANLTEVINTLGLKSTRIGTIIQTINNISKQTNLLALNAAIEAAQIGRAHV